MNKWTPKNTNNEFGWAICSPDEKHNHQERKNNGMA